MQTSIAGFSSQLDHACRLLEASPEVAHASHTNLPRRGEEWRQSADVTAFLQKGHVHFADSVRFHRRIEDSISVIFVSDMAELGKATGSRVRQQEYIQPHLCVLMAVHTWVGLADWCCNAGG